MAKEIKGSKALASYLEKLDTNENAPCAHLKVLPEDILCVESGGKYKKGRLVCSRTIGRQTGKDDVSMCTLTVIDFLEDGMLARCEMGNEIKINLIGGKITNLENP